ncbi:uncharacterized protein LOC114185650 isoform X2 [Vigna unguiculata]|uniref:uncharacterized protein LOC114185650 isoform X2 n=1 Tax=Vigna unguiculata TaxID=3917 RepID=UPI00101642A5|nr:uncharacterized protein LOC114185650 isoform X2 [Vigna unguiculata]
MHHFIKPQQRKHIHVPFYSVLLKFEPKKQHQPQNLQELQNPIRPFSQSPSCLSISHCPFWSAGETKRKFESVYEGGTMSTPDSGKVFQYWHCCGSEDPFDPGCTSSPHTSYDD